MDLGGIGNLVPNTQVGSSFTIRGVGTSSGITAEDGVGFYLDEVYRSSVFSRLFPVLDVERVEVLRGPQGTLFGKNTVGGAVLYAYRKPRMEPEGFVLVRPGNRGQVETRSVLNVPVGGWFKDRLAVRLRFASENYQGPVYNSLRDEYPGSRTGLNFVGTLRFVPTDRLTIDATGFWARTDGFGSQAECVFVGARSAGRFLPVEGAQEACEATRPFQIRSNVHPILTGQVASSWVVAQYDVGPVGVLDDLALRSISSWLRADSRARIDADLTELDYVQILELGESSDGFDGAPRRAREIQQEVQANATAWEGRVQLSAGFFSFWEDSWQNVTTLTPPVDSATNNQLESDKFTWALFGQGTVAVTDWAELTGGIRYTSESKSARQDLRNLNRPDRGPIVKTGDADFSSWTPMASLALFAPDSWVDGSWLDHLMGYFSYARGFKGGGFAALQDAFSVLRPFGPETLDSFEVGAKTTLAEGRLTLNVAAFLGKYDDIQRTQTQIRRLEDESIVFETFLQNAAKATIQGVELEGRASPLLGLELNGMLGVLDAKYDSFENAVDAIDATLVDRSGDRFGGPQFQSFLGIQYSMPVSAGGGKMSWLDGWLTPRVEWNYLSRNVTRAEAVSEIRRPGFNQFHARLSYSFSGDRAQVALWVRNLLDERVTTGGTFLPFQGLVTRSLLVPRRFGGEILFRF